MEVTNKEIIIGLSALLLIIIIYIIMKLLKSYNSPVKKLRRELKLKEKIKHEKLKSEKTISDIKKVEKENNIYKESRSVIKKSIFDINYWRNLLLKMFHRDKIVLVNIELFNGFFRSMLVKEKDNGFKYKNKQFIFDNELKYYNIDAKLYCYDYHENFALPVKRNIPITKVKKILDASGVSEVEYASNPSTLEQFVVSKIAEGIMKGQQLDEWMKQIRVLLIVVVIAVVIHLLLFVQASGVLKSINLPF